MKKFAKITAVMLLVALTVTALVACGFSSTGDPEKDKKKLEDKGYTVVYAEKEGLSAYKCSKSMEEILKLDEAEAEKVKVEIITILYFENEDDAKTAYDKAKDAKTPDGVKVSYKRSGKAVVGTMKGTFKELGDMMVG